MTNFDIFRGEARFEAFAGAAVVAERTYRNDASACALNCRRAMEAAVKWMYSVDAKLEKPYTETLAGLMFEESFREIVGEDLWKHMDFIRKTANNAEHGGNKTKAEEAALCLRNLFEFLDFVAHCYWKGYEGKEFDAALLETEEPSTVTDTPEVSLYDLMTENAALKEELTALRTERQATYSPKSQEISEFKTRKLYIDSFLKDAGWIEGENWLNEYELSGMPNKSGVGFADYVLMGASGLILAVIEAKRTCVDVAQGRQQAMLYADIIERRQGLRPVIFLSNGFETRIIDNQYPERRVAAIYSMRDLEKLFNLRRMRQSLKYVTVDSKIAGRYYQEAAVKAVCDCFGECNRRRALIVMATGAGKTRTVIALCKVLLQRGWVKDILFLADRTSLVTQAKRAFVNLLPELSVTNLCEEKGNYNAHCVFSTYPTMMNCIDSVRLNGEKIFSCGHFDLVICDEAHRSIYNKYRDIFTYFDSPLVGLTATPKDEIDRNTYAEFDLEDGVPTYGYELSQAVEDGYLVDYISVETKLKFLHKGIVYDDLSEEEKAEYEETFADDDGKIPPKMEPTALNNWIFNEDTIKKVLAILMTKGLRIDYGTKLGKTIIFAQNHKHAEKILEIFGKEYPHLHGYAKVIDNYINYAQSAIDEFSDPKKLPQIAISVDMLDTGIDIPEILNLVFFKRVLSKSKFWQMIGRGTRLCPGLMDGDDKRIFYIFDFCGNFEFFRLGKWKESESVATLQAALFKLQFEIAYKLQDLKYHTDKLIAYRNHIVEHLAEKVKELNRENFAIRQHLKYIERYSEKDSYTALTYEDTLTVNEEVAPYIEADSDDAAAQRFDALMYGMQLAYIHRKPYQRAKNDLKRKAAELSSLGTIPDVAKKKELIERILHTNYLDNAGIDDFEHIRENLRELMKYIPVNKCSYDTNFNDEILSTETNTSSIKTAFANYKAKAEYYIRKHNDNAAIAKLKGNVPLDDDDVKALEEILWSEVGSKEEYDSECGGKPLGEFVREIVGLDMNAAKTAFAKYLDGSRMDSRQIYFVNQIVEYIVHNGMMKDLSVLQETPFTDNGSVAEIFKDQTVWFGIRKIIDEINANAKAG